MYPSNPLSETPEIKNLYNRSHGLTDPGEQKNRNYNWNVDKNQHSFGKPQTIEMDGAKKSLAFDFIGSKYPKTTIVDKRLEDFRQATSDMVGRSKFKGTLHQSIGDNHSFGYAKNALNGEKWNVAKCIHGDPEVKNEKDFKADPDLGKSLLHKSKLHNIIPKEPNASRTFGIPSIRTDLKKRPLSSVTDLAVFLFFNLRIMGMKKMLMIYFILILM